MLSHTDLTPNANGAAIASGLMVAALFDLLIEKGVLRRYEIAGALNVAADKLDPRRLDTKTAAEILNKTVAGLAQDGQ
jgi:hypothetical protein